MPEPTPELIARTNELADRFEVMFAAFTKLQADAMDVLRALDVTQPVDDPEWDEYQQRTGYRRLWTAINDFHDATPDCWWWEEYRKRGMLL